MTTEIGWEKQLIDGIADTLVSGHPICNHSIPQRDEAACPADSSPVPMRFSSITFVIFFSPAAPFICGAVTTRQSGLHAATHFSFDPNENEWPSRRAAAQFSVLHEQEAKPRNPGFRLLNVDCSRVLDLPHGAQTLRVVMTSRMTIQ